jgi:nickel transport protein
VARALWLGFLLAFAANGEAHDLQYTTISATALVVTLVYPDGSPFSYESFEVYPLGNEIPFQVGRTDARGRLAFLPPGPGRYQVRAMSQDGHGLVFEVEADAAGLLVVADRPLYERYQRLFVGLGLLLGLFGLLMLFYRRKIG